MFCSCGTNAMPRRLISRGGNAWIGSPRSVMLPCEGCSSPAMVFSSVDLPAPFGPMMATISPSSTVRLCALQDLVVAPIPGDDVAAQPAGSRRHHLAMPPSHIRFLHHRIRCEFRERSLPQMAPLGHDNDRVTQRGNGVHVMLDQQH